jgi:glyoxylase-like metal-dependent hydrolase (beta-lactamase superfamily II)
MVMQGHYDGLSPDVIPEGLYLLDIPQSRIGFRCFISSWFFKDSKGRRILVDPGPANTIPALIDDLSKITDGVDLVLLTHIHLDHSGGIGQFCERYPNARVLAHPKALRHLIDPGKLWRSSLEVLGDIAEMYGEPQPLHANFLADAGAISGITVIETPGHSTHHLAFIVPLRDDKLVFAGEAVGLRLPIESDSGFPYLRPTTPPKFDGDAARESMIRLAKNLSGGELFCYSHWGVSRNSAEMISNAQKQLDEWISIISGLSGEDLDSAADILIDRDPLMGAYTKLPEDIKERERIFITNSARGIRGYLESSSGLY